MTIGKTTVNETLQAYLEDKGLNAENTESIVKKLHIEIANRERREREAKKRKKESERKREQRERECEKERRRKEREREKKIGKRTKTLHGTSCPRIMSKEGDLLAEF